MNHDELVKELKVIESIEYTSTHGKTGCGWCDTKSALRDLIARLEVVSETTDICPVCNAPGKTVQDRDGTAHFERSEP